MSEQRADAALRSLAEPGPPRPWTGFTSNLSVREAVLVDQSGYSPMSSVMGTSIYHVGAQFTTPLNSKEMDTLSKAAYAARGNAMRRLEAESREAGGAGVIGIRLTVAMIGSGESAEQIAQYTAIGTAVSEARTADRQRGDRHFTTDLDGQDLALLVRAGYSPLGLVMGCCVYHVRFQYVGRGTTIELSALTEAMYAAREIAMGRMQREAARLEAHGIVGVRITQGSYAWGSRLIEFLATGTAVRRRTREHRSLEPRLALDLRDPAAPTSLGEAVSRASYAGRRRQ